MKWIRRGENCWFYIRDTQPSSLADLAYKTAFNEDIIDCEKHEDWREIESGVLDTETGKLCITLKPVVPTLREAAAAMAEDFGDLSPHAANVDYNNPVWKRCLKSYASLKVALDREASTPANPYTKEAVDELLEAAREANDLWFTESRWMYEENKRLSRAFTALKKQREAANA